MQNKSNNKSYYMAGSLLITAIILGIIGLCALLSTEKTEISSVNSKNTEYNILSCHINEEKELIFNTANAEEAKHEVRAIFEDNKLSQISYMLDARYQNEKIAKNSEANFHALYYSNIDNVIENKDDLVATFAAADNFVKIRITADANNLNSKNIALFFLKNHEPISIRNYSYGDLFNIYTNKNFSCENNN